MEVTRNQQFSDKCLHIETPGQPAELSTLICEYYPACIPYLPSHGQNHFKKHPQEALPLRMSFNKSSHLLLKGINPICKMDFLSKFTKIFFLLHITYFIFLKKNDLHLFYMEYCLQLMKPECVKHLWEVSKHTETYTNLFVKRKSLSTKAGKRNAINNMKQH